MSNNISFSENPVLLFEDSRGVYIPANFAKEIEWEKFHGMPPKEDMEALKKGPDFDYNESYWEIWDEVLDNAYLYDKDGNEWRLYQEGDLWLYCYDLLSPTEKRAFLGEDIEVYTCECGKELDTTNGDTVIHYSYEYPPLCKKCFIEGLREGSDGDVLEQLNENPNFCIGDEFIPELEKLGYKKYFKQDIISGVDASKTYPQDMLKKLWSENIYKFVFVQVKNGDPFKLTWNIMYLPNK